MTTLRRRFGVPAVLVLSLAGISVLSGCSLAESVTKGVIDGAEHQYGSFAADTKNQMRKAVTDTLGGAGISADGEVPEGFPNETVTLIGEVRGGGAGPDSSGWVVRTTVSEAHPFGTATKALEKNSNSSTVVESGTDVAYGQFEFDEYTVLLSVESSGDRAMATYVVTKK